MLAQILRAFANIFKVPSLQSNLEEFIIAANPQTPDDVDRLEREFTRRQSSKF